jgi:hypothetical protein
MMKLLRLPNLAPAFLQQIVKKYEPTRLGRQELNAELLVKAGLAPKTSIAFGTWAWCPKIRSAPAAKAACATAF